MKHSFWIALVIVLGSPCFQHSVALAQDSLHSPTIQIQTQTSEPQYRMPIAPQDTSYKYNMPTYNPEKQNEIQPNDSLEIAYQPKIVFPADPKLHGMEAKVTVKVLVDASGSVQKAEVLKSSNHLFDKYALDYAKQYRFKVRGEKKKIETQWISIGIRFKQ
jgi:TonB family protein